MCSRCALFLAVLVLGPVLQSAETGDYDGDGKLTIRDVLLIHGGRENPDLSFNLAAPGSLDAFAEYPPQAARPDPSGFDWRRVATSVYLESLRRSLSGPFPTYSFMHWPDTWLADIEQGPLPEDPRVSVRLLPVETAGEHRIRVAMELTVSAPVKAFSIALESEEGVLRVPWVWGEEIRDEFTWALDIFLRVTPKSRHASTPPMPTTTDRSRSPTPSSSSSGSSGPEMRPLLRGSAARIRRRMRSRATGTSVGGNSQRSEAAPRIGEIASISKHRAGELSIIAARRKSCQTLASGGGWLRRMSVVHAEASNASTRGRLPPDGAKTGSAGAFLA